MMATLGGRFQVLLHHRPAVPVPHDLAVAHAVALADCSLRKVLVGGLVMRPGRMVRSRAAMDLAAVVDLGAVLGCAVPMRMCGPMVVRVVLPRRPGGEVRKRRRQFGRRPRNGWRELGRRRRGRRFDGRRWLIRRGLLSGDRRSRHRHCHGNAHEHGTTHVYSPPAALRFANGPSQDSATPGPRHPGGTRVQPSRCTSCPVDRTGRLMDAWVGSGPTSSPPPTRSPVRRPSRRRACRRPPRTRSCRRRGVR